MNKVAFVMYQYPLGVSTMILNTIVELVKRDIGVALFIDEETFNVASLDYRHPLFSLHLYPTETRSLFYRGRRKLIGSIQRITGGRVCRDIRSYSSAYDPQMVRYLSFILSEIDSSFTHVIGVEALGISLAAQAANKKKLLYFNMELLQEKSCSDSMWKSIKAIELAGLNRVEAVIIQNKERADVFAAENGFDRERIAVLPIFPLGDCIVERGDTFREMFGIPQHKTVVLYAGNFQPWAQCNEIIRSVRKWSNDFVLVMHTWNKGCLSTEYYREMLRSAEGLPVYFSTEPVEHGDLPSLLASASIGILFYEAIDENFTEILGSSNKLAEYLKACLPVVTSSGGSLGDFVVSRRIGVAVDSFANIPAALDEIRNNYGSYREACERCYGNELDFGRHFDNVYESVF